ncbi:MAG: hypothetical protein ACI9TH_003387 [Kiritimatiellia bacterium]|jgi:hypothetical protein
MLHSTKLHSRPLVPFGLLALLCICTQLQAEDLYVTDFSTFTVGANQWVGTDGWIGNSTGVNAHGIDEDSFLLIPTARLGLNQPSSTTVKVYRPLNRDVVAEGTPIVDFASVFSLVESSNGRLDRFWFSFYTADHAFLAGVQLNTAPLNHGVWYSSGDKNTLSDSGLDFIDGALHDLSISVDLLHNTWNVNLDNLPAVFNETFHTGTNPLDLGYIAIEWQLSAPLPLGYGNNYLLLFDYVVQVSEPLFDPDLLFTRMGQQPNGNNVLTFIADPEYTYQVEYTDDLKTWRTDLLGSFYAYPLFSAPVQFSDPSWNGIRPRYYRLARRR